MEPIICNNKDCGAELISFPMNRDGALIMAPKHGVEVVVPGAYIDKESDDLIIPRCPECGKETVVKNGRKTVGSLMTY